MWSDVVRCGQMWSDVVRMLCEVMQTMETSSSSKQL